VALHEMDRRTEQRRLFLRPASHSKDAGTRAVVTRQDLFAPALATAGLAPDRIIYSRQGTASTVQERPFYRMTSTNDHSRYAILDFVGDFRTRRARWFP
jgi:hypothetical protein